nr:DedA family protein [Arthrobacter zhangbolii]
MDFLSVTVDGINSFILSTAGSPWVYIGLFLCCLIDGFFPPVPSESLVVALASLAMSGAGVNIWLIIPAAALGAFLGDNLAYLMGRGIGMDRFAWMRRPKTRRSFAWARHELEKRSVSLILVARFIPVGRVVVNLTAGATGFPRRRFVFLTAISGAVWAAYSVAIGAIAGAWFTEHHLLGVVVGVSGALVLGLVIDRIITMVRGTAPGAPRPAEDTEQAEDDESTRKAA